MYATFLLSLVCFCLGESLPVILGCKYNLFWSGLSGETQWMLLKIWTQREIWLDPLRRVRSDKSLSDVYYRQRNIETRHTLHLYTVHIFVYINNSLAHKDTSQVFPPMSRFHVDRRTGCSVFSLSPLLSGLHPISLPLEWSGSWSWCRAAAQNLCLSSMPRCPITC